MTHAKPIEASPTLTFDLPVLKPRPGRAQEREQQPGRIPRLARRLHRPRIWNRCILNSGEFIGPKIKR